MRRLMDRLSMQKISEALTTHSKYPLTFMLAAFFCLPFSPYRLLFPDAGTSGGKGRCRRLNNGRFQNLREETCGR